MKVFGLEGALCLVIILVISPSTCGLTDGLSSASTSTAKPGDKKEGEGGNTVNVISQNAVEASQNATEVFLERLERKNTLTHIQTSIDTLSDKLKDIENNVENRLIKINASGIVYLEFWNIDSYWRMLG